MLIQVQDLLGAKWDLWLSQNYARRREAEHHDQDMIQLLRNVPTLKLLTQTQLEGLLSDFALEKFNEGDMIIEEGEGGDKYYVIKAGAVIVAIEDGATGENKQVATMQRGDQFGERALITDEPRAASIFAAEDGVEVLSLTREAFEDKLGGFKELMEQEVLRKETEAVVKHRTIGEDEKWRDSLAPTVFIGKPADKFLCPVCKDVLFDPVVASLDGMTYCRTCIPVPAGATNEYINSCARDLSVSEIIFELPTVCKNALAQKDGVEGAALWVYNMRGCQARCTLNTRGAHEANCPFQLALCGLPGPGHKERCHELFTKHDIVKHREECSFRLVPCLNTERGCSERVPQRKMAEHTIICHFGFVDCPNGCKWVGLRKFLAGHRKKCPLEIVHCGIEDTENPGESCQHTCTRRQMEAHKKVCEFQHLECGYCKKSVSLFQKAQHSNACNERETLCDRCGRTILERRLKEHQDLTCPASEIVCPFKPLGCLERHNKLGMQIHEQEERNKHIRMISHEVEAFRKNSLKYKEEVAQITERTQSYVASSDEKLAKLAERCVAILDNRAELVAEAKRRLKHTNAEHAMKIKDMEAEFKITMEKNAFQIARIKEKNVHLEKYVGSLVKRKDAVELERAYGQKIQLGQAYIQSIKDKKEKMVATWEGALRDMQRQTEDAALRMAADVEGTYRRAQEYQSRTVEATHRLWEDVRGKLLDTLKDVETLSTGQTELEERIARCNQALGRPKVGITAQLVSQGLGLGKAQATVKKKAPAEGRGAAKPRPMDVRADRKKAEWTVAKERIDGMENRLAERVKRGRRGPRIPGVDPDE